MSLVQKTTQGLFWVSISIIMVKIINFVVTAILARLLEPKDFGLIAIAFIIVNFFDLLKDMGVGTALIYTKKDYDKTANTVFFLLPGLAAVFYVICYFVAPLAADFFNEPDITAIIRVLGLIFVIQSFWGLPSGMLDKNLEFNKGAIIQILPKIGYGISAIWLALNGFGVWSIVIGWLFLEVISLITTWSIVKWRPSFKFDRKIAVELLSYGKHVIVASIIVFLISIVDVTYIGRILGPGDLGLYSIALSSTGLLTSQVSLIMGRVSFPVYSSIRDKKDTLKKVYINIIRYTSLITIPASFGIFAIAWDFVKIVYGEKWLPAVAVFQVLSFYGLNRSLLSTTEQLYLAAGKPEVRTKLNLLQLVLMSVLMYPLTMRYGILGTSIAVVLPSTLIVFLTFREAGKIIEENFMYIARPLLPAIAGSIIMLLAIGGWQYISIALSPVLRLAVSVVLGVSVYVAFLWVVRRELFYEIRELITRQ